MNGKKGVPVKILFLEYSLIQTLQTILKGALFIKSLSRYLLSFSRYGQFKFRTWQYFFIIFKISHQNENSRPPGWKLILLKYHERLKKNIFFSALKNFDFWYCYSPAHYIFFESMLHQKLPNISMTTPLML